MNAIPETRSRSSRTEAPPLLRRIASVKSATRDTLSSSARLLLRCLIDYLGNDDSCWPSVRRLADETGLSVRQCQRILRDLQAAGWITLESRFRPDGSQTSNLIRWTAAAPDTDVTPPLTPAAPHEKSCEKPIKQHVAPAGDVVQKIAVGKVAARCRGGARRGFLRFDSERMSDGRYAVQCAMQAESAGLLNGSESARLSFVAAWVEVMAKYRTGKVQHPERLMQHLLRNTAHRVQYVTDQSETRARRLLRDCLR